MFTLGAIACPSCASSLLAIEFHASPDGLDGSGRLRCPACSARLNVTIKLAVVPAPRPTPDPMPPDGLEDLVHVTGHDPQPEDHVCGICGATFTTPQGVATHARIHEEARPCTKGCGKMIKPSGQGKHSHYCTGPRPTSGRAGVATPTGTPPPIQEDPPSTPPPAAPTAATPSPTTTPPAPPSPAAGGSDAPAPKAPRPPSLTSPPSPKSSSSSTEPPPPSPAPTPSTAAPAPPPSAPTPTAPTAGTPAPTSRAAAPPTAPSRPTTKTKSTTTTRGTSPRPDRPTPATIDEAYAPGPPLAGRSRGTCGFYYGPSAGVCGVSKDPGDDPWRRIRRDGLALDLCPAHTDLDDDELADAFENLAHPA